MFSSFSTGKAGKNKENEWREKYLLDFPIIFCLIPADFLSL
jgi:hypothetical protein